MLEHKIKLQEAFHTEAGDILENVEIVYHTSARPYNEGDKVIWICHALTANSDVEDWWPQLTGESKLLDPEKYYLVCVNILCSPYGSTCPLSTNPKTLKPYFLDFPQITIRDIIKTNKIVRKHLGIEKVDLLIGSSIGGFQAIEWAIEEPEVIKNAIFMATAPRVSPWLTAMAEAQRMALRADSTFLAQESPSGGKAGLECARAQALITYRCHRGYRLTQSEEDDDTLFASRAASYERYQGQKLVRRNFDAYSYYYICDMLDSHNCGRGRGGVQAALGQIKANTAVVVIDTDIIFPVEEARSWASFIPGSKLYEISSDFGHDGFLLETETISEIIKNYL